MMITDGVKVKEMSAKARFHVLDVEPVHLVLYKVHNLSSPPPSNVTHILLG